MTVRAPSRQRGLLPDYQPFVLQARPDPAAARLEFVPGGPPDSMLEAWRHATWVMNTGSTWALTRTGDAAWPYLFGPAPHAPRQPPLYFAAVAADLACLRVYLEDRPQHVYGTRFYPLDELFTRLFLSAHDGVLLHAAGIIQRLGGCDLFLGDSGAGKSTIAALHESVLGPNRVLSDDRVILRRAAGGWMAYGSPWHGSLPRALALGVPLKGLYFLQQSPQHTLRSLAAAEAVQHLLPVALGPIWLAERTASYLSVIAALAADRSISKAVLGFTPDASIVPWLEHAVLA